ncbi:class I SAM-dependent methyltransferase [Arthrobacter sp. Br18]|uniref:class I SAM-dependent methyltransferase n=1 Tax=Arthrobacter sp. Br18 TaxID=1312954 RepID=UPI0004B59D6C|nr:class I SAM-dependent methyltransferase [Arthrobacter sp. Br18]
MLSDFIQAWNQGRNVELYETENEAIDHAGNLWSGLVAAAPWSDKDLLDLGCGSGFWLTRYAGTARCLFGVEPDGSLLGLARARTSAADVLHGSAEHIPLPDASIDVIHARFAYFFPSPTNDCDPGLREALRVLRPGGTLVVIDNDQQDGEFAELLHTANTAAHQGPGEYIQRWWKERGATTERIMSSWTFTSPQELQAVISMEFPKGSARPWIEAHPDRETLSYGYLLHTLRKGRELAPHLQKEA